MADTPQQRPSLKAYSVLFLRGFIIVTLTAMNTSQIAREEWLPAWVVGFGISWVWFYNARTAALTALPRGGEVYALGAACGTLFGMFLAHLIRAMQY